MVFFGQTGMLFNHLNSHNGCEKKVIFFATVVIVIVSTKT